MSNSSLFVEIDSDLYWQFKIRCAKNKVSHREAITQLVTQYVEEKDDS